MMKRWIAIFLLLASNVAAGAWPREKGEGFLFAATQIMEPAQQGQLSNYSTLYVEYGLSPRATLGVDIGHSVSGESKFVLFMRSPLYQSDTGHVFSAELGLGQISGSAVIRPGLSYGYGFSKARRSGWLSADLLLERHLEVARTDYKIDLTYGRNLAQGRKALLQLQGGKQKGDPSFLRLAPSFVVPLNTRTHAELGTLIELKDHQNFGLKIGIWRSF